MNELAAGHRRSRIGVRELVEHVLRSGDLNLERLGVGSSSKLDGIRAHQKLQRSRGDGYEKEVAVSRVVESDGLSLAISGRIDGVLTTPESVIVEEIKTTHGDIGKLADALEPTHWGQLEVYAYLLADDRGLEEVVARLTYYQLDSEDVRELERRVSRAKLEERFDTIVQSYLEWARRIEEWSRIRDRSLDAAGFPFAAYRAGQRSMAVSVYRTIEEGDQLMVRAPTGIGKTQAALFPSLKATGLGLVEKVFYLTARSTGRAAAESALDELRRVGVRAKSVSLTAKEKICFNPERSCTGEDCEYARGFYDRLDAARAELFEHDDFTRSRVETVALAHRVCPFELSLELARWSEVLIGDYNYVFDPRTHLRRLFDEGSKPYAFLVDEAHHLPDRAREMYSAELRDKDVLRTRRGLDKQLHRELWKSLGAIHRAFLRARPSLAETGASPEPPSWLLPSLRKWVSAVETYLEHGPVPHPSHRDILELFFGAVRFLRVAESFDERYVTCYENRGAELRVRLFCIDPAEELSQTLARSRSTVLFSATLAPFHFFQKTLGLDDETHHLALASPFSHDNLLVLVGDRIATTYRRRESSRAELTRWLRSFVSHKKGNYLIFFPSYAYLSAVVEGFASSDDDGTATPDMVVQRADMTDAERVEFIAQFEADRKRTLVGFAVMGGVFGEGIDLVGERLDGVAIIGVGLPGLSPERDHMRDHFQQSQGAGFDYAYAFPGMNRVLQAAGRLIRSETDRGTVLLIDERFSEPRYRRQLPPDWVPRYVGSEEALAAELQDFWSSRPPMP